MIEIFYYIGLLCLASCLEEVINIKRLKRTNKFANETLNDGAEGIMSGEGKELSERLSSVGDVYKKASKKISNARLIIGFVCLLWNVVGIFITEQRMFFIVLLIITLVSPYVIRMTTKDEKQQVILSYMTNIASLILVSAVIYNHFFKNVL
jgi:hypothetical protein